MSDHKHHYVSHHGDGNRACYHCHQDEVVCLNEEILALEQRCSFLLDGLVKTEDICLARTHEAAIAQLRIEKAERDLKTILERLREVTHGA